MASSPPIAVYDACVLYPFQLRNLLVQCAADRLVEARWSDDIHDEWMRNLLAKEPRLTRTRLEATRDLMDRVLPQARVTGYEARIPAITLPDPEDRHVVAAAAEAGASVIVTWNVRDFPAAELRRHGLRKLTPDGLLTALYEEDPDTVAASVENARRNLNLSRVSKAAYLEVLHRQGLNRFVSALS
ncbi:PIN domain-containing protein [Phenylobacterium sp.]|uniref:PIN domain-containing protein n=1 Tax=Phenylobacterium sp. TaxID=1871053 RepID=UPI003BA9765A